MPPNFGDKISMKDKMTPNENLQQAYMMLLNSKDHLRRVKENTFLKTYEINDLIENISDLENNIYKLIVFFGGVNDQEAHNKYDDE